MEAKFKQNDLVSVSSEGGWRHSIEGVICSDPEPIELVSGKSYQYWVSFNSPQYDIDGDGPYRKGQILEEYLSVHA